MELDLVEIWSHMGNLVRGVVVVLTIQAVACISVVIDRLIMMYTSKRKSKKFALSVGKQMARGDYAGVLAVANQTKGSHLAQLIGAGLRVFLDQRKLGFGQEKAAEMTGRALERTGDNLSSNLHRGMNVLASTGSTAPFVGLLGTVLGILNAFKLIAEQGSGGIGTIGAAIGEALVVTGYGLTIAIPSVLLFNWLSGRIADLERGLANASGELVDTLACGHVIDEAPEEESGETTDASRVVTDERQHAVAATA